MSGDRYKIQDQQGLYFLTPTIIHWIDVFTRKEYRDIIVDSLNHCIKTKGLIVTSWMIMSNHLHLIVRVNKPNGLSGVLRDFKKYTSKQILKSQKVEESGYLTNFHLKQKELEEQRIIKCGKIVIMLSI